MHMARTTQLWTAVASVAAAGLLVYWLAEPGTPSVPATSVADRDGARPSAVPASGPATLPPGHPYAALSGDDRTTQAAVAYLQDRFVALSAEVALLRQQVATHAGRQHESATPDRLEQPSDPAGRAEADRANRQSAQARDAAFRAEPTDARWSGTTAATLRQMLAAPGQAPVAVRAVDCRAKTCRVEIAANGTGDMNELLAGIASRMTDAVGAMVVDPPSQDSPNGATVLYFSR
jgi:hypothetical protein